MTRLSISNAARIDVGQLPSIPRVLLKLIEASHKVDVSFKELAGVIQQDPALSAKVIAIANSPFYAQWNDVRDFNRLLVVLGLNTIKTIAITSAVHQFFSQFDTKLGKWMGTFWSHSLTCAYAAKALANLTSYMERLTARVCDILAEKESDGLPGLTAEPPPGDGNGCQGKGYVWCDEHRGWRLSDTEMGP